MILNKQNIFHCFLKQRLRIDWPFRLPSNNLLALLKCRCKNEPELQALVQSSQFEESLN